MSTTIIKCANCGKGEESSDDLKACTACKLVKYCNRNCQIAHRPQHKKACKKRAAELYDAALFEEHAPEECPICFLPLSSAARKTFFSCCGKDICNGCVFAVAMSGAKEICPFCRTPPSSSDEDEVKRVNKIMEKGNPSAYSNLAGFYAQGIEGLPQDWAKANELYLKAGELGHAGAYYNLGQSYTNGNGVTIDKQKAKNYYELAAMNGHVHARHNLGVNEHLAGNHERAIKHFEIAACAGCKESLGAVQDGYMDGDITKDEYANTLRACQKSQDEMKSDARDKALAYHRRIELASL